MWQGDDASEFEMGANKRRDHVPKYGRRAVNEAERDDVGPAPGEKKSGWGSEVAGASASGTEKKITDNIDYNWDDENDDDDLPKEKKVSAPEDEIIKQIASAPAYSSPIMQSIKELDSKVQHTLPVAVDVGVDLSILASFLCPYQLIVEQDEMWEWESLFIQISSQLQSEKEAKEKENQTANKEEEDVDLQTDAPP
eukprot:TRINITY_DN5351_c0_g1_i1.p1 TRINITY_DN5351_c0_g1~~TRINITY_DN5351_c0_g1_i1.p1  ORF type:complete len:196 (+),score=56.25 TRINITY_DN5351_c0_g1_i1:84-671(+)